MIRAIQQGENAVHIGIGGILRETKRQIDEQLAGIAEIHPRGRGVKDQPIARAVKADLDRLGRAVTAGFDRYIIALMRVSPPPDHAAPNRHQIRHRRE